MKLKMSEKAKAALKYFYEQYKKDKPEGRGHMYNASFAKDGVLFQYLTDRFPLAWVKGMIDFYLQWDDPFVIDAGYSVGVFYHKVNQMLELNIHKSRWTEKHEKRHLMPAAKIMENILEEIVNGKRKNPGAKNDVAAES